jgi:3-dehydroquinate synthase class II
MCPTLFVWNGTDYVYETLLDIHGDSDVTLQHRIEQSIVKDGIFYKLSLRELDEFTSHIDQVKLYAVDSQGEWHICPLISAIHNEQGWVTLQLRFDDNNRVDMHPTETIDLKFTYIRDNIAYFIFEINGHNKKIE